MIRGRLAVLVLTVVIVLLALVSTLIAGTASDDSSPGRLPGEAPAGRAGEAPGRSTGAGRGMAGQREAVLAAYRRFWWVASRLDSRPQPQWRPLLAAVTAEPLLSRVLSGLEAETRAGHRQYGVVLLRPTVVDADAERASIVDCQDASRSGLTDVDTGLAVTVGSARTAVTAVLTRDHNGTWRVSDARYLQDPC
jgi:hypothetical protein